MEPRAGLYGSHHSYFSRRSWEQLLRRGFPVSGSPYCFVFILSGEELLPDIVSAPSLVLCLFFFAFFL